jgi:hypothetical protein
MNIHEIAEQVGTTGDGTLDHVRLTVAMTKGNPELVREVKIEPLEYLVKKSLEGRVAIKACYHNTWEALKLVKRPDARYVLGFWECCLIPVDHCFLKYDGRYFDPTGEFFFPGSTPRYFTMHELTVEEVKQARKFMMRRFGCRDYISTYEWRRYQHELGNNI